MLVIRLTRTGKKNASSFRIILTEKTKAAKSGRFLEVLGSYNPRLFAKDKGVATGGKEITLKEDRIKYWLSQGAKASDTVHNLLVDQGVVEGPKIAKKIKSKKDKGATDGEQPISDEKSSVEDGEKEQEPGKETETEETTADVKIEEKPAEEKKEDKKEDKKEENQPEDEKK